MLERVIGDELGIRVFCRFSVRLRHVRCVGRLRTVGLLRPGRRSSASNHLAVRAVIWPDRLAEAPAEA